MARLANALRALIDRKGTLVHPDPAWVDGRKFTQLSMVATSTWRLPNPASVADEHEPKRPEGHAALLAKLLEQSDDGKAWICLDPVSKADVAAERGVPHEKDDSCAQLCSGLADAIAVAFAAAAGPHDDWALGRQLGELRHRVFLDQVRLRKLCKVSSETLAAYASLDFDIYHRWGELRVQTILTLWARCPRHPRFLPEAELAADWRDQPLSNVEEYEETFVNLATEMDDLLACYFGGELAPVLGEWHFPPLFWLVQPTGWPTAEIVSDLEPDQLKLAGFLLPRLLGVADARDCLVNNSVVNGELLVLRHFDRIPAPREVQRLDRQYRMPRYLLLIPDSPRSQTPDIEILASRVVTKLAELETHGRQQLSDITSDLEIWRHHMRVYDCVAQAGFLIWDRLSQHMPGRGPSLARVHRAVGLLHLTLLQGVADLANLVALIDECRARVIAAEEHMLDEYDLQFSERHRPEGKESLRDALDGTGLFDQVKKRADQIAKEAARVRAHYVELIDTISRAYDERRVRELDVLQKAGVTLSALMGVLGLLFTVLSPVLNLIPQDLISSLGGGHLPSIVAEVIIGASLAAIGFVVWASIRLSVRLGDRGFHRLYRGRRRWRIGGVLRYLMDSSTEALEAFKDRHGDTDKVWDKHDLHLAREFARLWVEAGRLAPHESLPRRAKADIRALNRRVGSWTVRTLLLTERARRMHSYKLPRLALLYRRCGIAQRLLFAADEPTVSMVADIDLHLLLRDLGFTWDQADEIDKWLGGPAPADPHQLLELLSGDNGASVSMDQKRRTAFLNAIRAHSGALAQAV